jgi:hypothetical protein
MKASVSEEIATKFWAHTEKKINGCWIYKSRSISYATFGAKINGNRIIFLAHRFAWLIATGELLDGMVINHKCCNKLCVNPDHLEQVTQRQNMEDAYEKGLIQKGETYWTQNRLDFHNRFSRREKMTGIKGKSGGKRAGAGRPRANGERHNIYVTAQTWAYLNQTGEPSQMIEKLTEEKMNGIKVTNLNGIELDYDAAVNLMNNDLRERIANDGKEYTAQQFMRAYEIAHLKKFGEEWELSKQNPVW